MFCSHVWQLVYNNEGYVDHVYCFHCKEEIFFKTSSEYLMWLQTNDICQKIQFMDWHDEGCCVKV